MSGKASLILLLAVMSCLTTSAIANSFASNLTANDITFSSAILSWELPSHPPPTESLTYQLLQYKALINNLNYTITDPSVSSFEVSDLRYATHYQFVLVTLDLDNGGGNQTVLLGSDTVHFVTLYEHAGTSGT